MAHTACLAWLKEHGKTARSAPFEEYVSDPATEKDPSKWLTKVYYSY
jgi:effector-binding domain-containing protein